ncbi:Calycin domain and Calycin domain-containing protein [Trichostrongylus colubriformis]|uniref:Calycin domain and Calycin domain-containing protein n=1 Tax=Trichostrongylus colubriformis TaxID=6319 RepID=A0AAN8FIA5_TRICO
MLRNTLILFGVLVIPSILAIGENTMDINTITGIIGGLGRMLETNVDTINVPSDLIMGRWFQMYKAAINFDVFRTQMYCPIAYFSPNPIMGEDGFSMEEAYRTVSKTGPIETYKRDMNKVGPGQYWMYTEEYFYPRQFYIIAAGPSYHNETGKADEPIQYIAVTDANRLSLAVYARDPHTFYQKYNKDILEFMEKKGFGGRVFWNSPRPIYQGPDCEWPSEKEVFARRVLKNQELAERSRNGTTEPDMSGMPLADILRDPKKTLERLVGNQEVSADQLDMQCLCALVVAVVISPAIGQHDAFALPQAPRFAPKPTVPPEYSSFFELDGHARELVDSLLGPRPGGLFPEKTYEIGAPAEPAAGSKPVHVPSTLERTLEQFFTAPEPASGQALPPGFGSGFSLLNNNKPVTTFGSTMRRAPEKLISAEVEGSGQEPKSSIMGIPKVFPKLPKAPISQPEPYRSREPTVIGGTPNLPIIPAAPEVPEGGFLPAEIRRSPQSVSGVASSLDDDSSDVNEDEFGSMLEESSTSSGGLIGTIFDLIGMGQKKLAGAKGGALGALGTKASDEDKNAFGKAVSNLIGGENSPLPAKNMISNVLYKALTSGSIQPNDTKAENPDDPLARFANNGTIVLTPAQSAAITENLEMVQNFIIQPSSPLCTQKPEPVAFDIYSFMGQWYQVVYSPPFSSGQCSMVAYKKLNDVNNGGPGSIFEIFEYTTDGTPYGKPKISSGYAMIRSPGELIYRTTSNQEDVNVHVLHVGPVNANNEYEYVIMSTNCNFPLYVFARDPIMYKQRYESEVNAILEKKGLVNGISRLLNIIAPVENSLCTFPPSLFNING